MNTFLKNGWIQKLVIAIVIVLLFNFIYPNYVHAGIASSLTDPIVGFAVMIGDGAMWLLQKILYGTDEVIINTNPESSGWAKFWGAVAGVLTAVALVAINFIPGVGQVVTIGLMTALVVGGAVGVATYSLALDALPENFELPVFYISPMEIFSNFIAFLDVDFFSPNDYSSQSTGASGGQTISQQESSAKLLQKAISNVYLALRVFAMVVLLSVLVYIAIRIILASTGQDKAKYKSMLFNWVVAICLLFMLHYIMVFCMVISEKISEALIAKNDILVVEMPEVDTDNDTVKQAQSGGVLKWNTNFAGKARMELQLGEAYGLSETNAILNKIGWTIVYIMLIFYTIYFFIAYAKRLIYLAFLTMIAPLICMMYPIDKVKDGQSQTFDMWLKEYIFNVLLQPLHLLLYTILIGMASDLASENIIYVVAAIGFLIPAEKFFRRMFGFDKAQTAGAAGSFAAGALASQGLNKLMSLAAPKKEKNKKDGESGDNNQIRTQDNPELGSGDDNNNGNNNDDDDDSQYNFWGNNDDNNGYDDNDNDAGYGNQGQLGDGDRDEALERYNQEGFGQNSAGVYYNPWTDEYDEGYDPHNDPSYMLQQQERANAQLDQQLDERREEEQEEEQEDRNRDRQGTMMGARRLGNNANDSTGRIPTLTRRQRLGQYLKNTARGNNKTGRALRVGGAHAGKFLGKKFKGLPKKALKAYAGLIVGGGLGLVGLAASLADGKPGNTMKNTAALFGAGYLGTSALIEKGSSGATRLGNNIKDEYNQEQYGTTDKQEIKQIKAAEKTMKRFEQANRDMFNNRYGSNSQRYMDIAKQQIQAGNSEEEALEHIRTREETFNYLNDMSASERRERYGTEDVVQLEDDYMQYMDSGVRNREIIDKAMQVEKTGIEYEGIEGTVHKSISREEGMAAAVENQKIEDKYNEERAESEAAGRRVRSRREIGDAYMQNKHARNVEKATERGMDTQAAQAFANRSDAATEKVRSMI